MAVLQTSLQDADNIILESGQIEISMDDGLTWIDLGLADNIVVTFNSTPREVQPGNGATPDIAKGSASQMSSLAADLWELSTQNLVDISGGLFTRTTVAGSPVVDDTDVLAVNTTVVSVVYPFVGQQGSGVVPTAIEITDTGGTYVLNTDYSIAKLGNGKWGYYFITGGDYDPTGVITVEYTYTPNVSTKVTVGGSSSQTSIQVRITNVVLRTDVAYDIENQWIIYNAFVEGDMVVALKNKDEADAVARIPINLKGSLDDSRSVGDQLMSFERTHVAH